MSAVPLSYSCGSAEPALLGRTIDEILSESAARFPHGEALVVCHQGVRLTYAEFQSKVRQTAKGLLALGIRNGDRVGIWACNCEEWVLTQFATAAIGAILVNINPAYGTRELDYALRQSGTHTLVFHSHFKQSNYPAILEEICPEIAQCRQGHLRARTLPGLRRVVFLGEGKKHDWLLWQELGVLAQSVSDETLAARQAELTFEDPINIQYTSGTTGFPKGVVLTHHNLVNNALFIASSMNLSDQDRICIPVPFYHCFGMVLGNLTAALAGATMVIPSATFDAAHTLRAVEQERCTALYGVPSMFIAELEHPEFARFHLGTLRTGIMAGSPCPIEVMKKVVERMNCREITIAYGQTESSPVITQTSVDDSIERRVATVGRALPHTEVKIVDPVSGRIVPRGQPGELCSRGYLIMKGYFRNRKATSEAIDSDGWLHTGDLAVMNTDGYVNITGRARDMIIRGGENIYPREIEEFLYTHPKISDAQVIGVPDRKFGEEVMAWIRLKEGETSTVEEIRAFCKGKIAHYKIPRFFKFVNEYPMTISGKVQKYRMREIAIQELGLQELTTIQTA
ncbi:MAG TPA: AMP-binding protein [Terriglobia bacterium]|nr:AMP-binding protein [Terriglobia bacterium]